MNMSVIIAWYGEQICFYPTGVDEEEEKCKPVIDGNHLRSQWNAFKPTKESRLSLDSAKTFKTFNRYVFAQSKLNDNFRSRNFQVIMLYQTADVFPCGTTENERIFTCAKRIDTSKKTSLSAQHLEDLVMLSHEAKHMFGPTHSEKIIFLTKNKQMRPELLRRFKAIWQDKRVASNAAMRERKLK